MLEMREVRLAECVTVSSQCLSQGPASVAPRLFCIAMYRILRVRPGANGIAPEEAVLHHII